MRSVAWYHPPKAVSSGTCEHIGGATLANATTVAAYRTSSNLQIYKICAATLHL